MTDKYTIIKKEFQHVVLEGTAYEVGYQQGEFLKKYNPNRIKYFTSGNVEPKKLGFNDFEELKSFYEEFCPGINDELEGFAEKIGVKMDKLPMYGPPIYEPGNCSQIAVLSSALDTDHTYVGRSYEFHHEMNDLRFCTTRIKGKPKQMGFTEFLVFRDDGLNEYGLCVTISGGGTFKATPTKKGFPFFLVVRALLDNCRSVTEAIEYLNRIPVHGYWNFLLTDKNNNAALIQFFDGESATKQIHQGSSEPFLFSTNHYVLPEMIKYQQYAGDWILVNSKKRFEVIGSTLRKLFPNITKKIITDLLSKELYKGVAGYYYSDYFGTLFSIIYDLTNLKADVCFGIPTHNDWQKPLTLNDPNGIKLYNAVFPDKSIKLDELWTD